MVGRRNESGTRLKCHTCGWSWFYQGSNAITSCPHCKATVRVFYPQPGSGRQPVDNFNKTDQLF